MYCINVCGHISAGGNILLHIIPSVQFCTKSSKPGSGFGGGRGSLAPLGPITGLPPLRALPQKPGVLAPVRPPPGVVSTILFHGCTFVVRSEVNALSLRGV